MRPFAFALFAPLTLLAACVGQTSSGGSSSSSSSETTYGDTGTCHYPAGVPVSSTPSGPGCFAHPPGQVCQVSNGATVLPDGGVANGTESCSSMCASSDYGMTCNGASAGPAASLGCQIVPIPTPSDVAIYCCPCE
jgi:hypothetical protein